MAAAVAVLSLLEEEKIDGGGEKNGDRLAKKKTKKNWYI